MPSQSLLDRGIGVVGFRSVSSFGIRFIGFFDSGFLEKTRRVFQPDTFFLLCDVSFIIRRRTKKNVYLSYYLPIVDGTVDYFRRSQSRSPPLTTPFRR